MKKSCFCRWPAWSSPAPSPSTHGPTTTWDRMRWRRYAISCGAICPIRICRRGGRAEPDRRHEQPSSRSPSRTATSRPATARPARSHRPSAATRSVQALGFFNTLMRPPPDPGDNDWTDCDRPSNGGFNSLERLDHERQVFFSTPFSLGQKRIRMEVQSTPLCLGFNGPTPCVENRRWNHRGVTYVTLNIQGSCNNLCDTAPNPAEFAARNQANIAWMRDAFLDAQARGSAAIMIIAQADPGWDLSDGTRAPLRNPQTLAQTDGQPDGYQEFLIALLRRSGRLSQARRLRARRLPLLPGRQAVPGFAGPPAGEFHARGDLRRQPGQREQRRQLAQGDRRCPQPGGLHLPDADRSGQPHRRPGPLRRSRAKRVISWPAPSTRSAARRARTCPG